MVVLGPSVFRRSDERGPSSLDAARSRLAAIHQSRRSDSGRPRLAVQTYASGLPGGSTRPHQGPSQAHPFAPPSLRNRHVRRRAQILQVLFGCCVLSVLLAVGTSVPSLWLLHLAVDAVLVLYILIVRSVTSRSRRRPVRRAAAPAQQSMMSRPVALFDADQEFFDDHNALRFDLDLDSDLDFDSDLDLVSDREFVAREYRAPTPLRPRPATRPAPRRSYDVESYDLQGRRAVNG